MTDKIECYKEVCESIRETDRISFRLLSLIPLSTTFGAALLTFIQSADLTGYVGQSAMSASVIILSLVGATIVYGFYKWELRNIDKCNSLIGTAAEMEDADTGNQYSRWSSVQAVWGKTRSEKLIYRVAIGAWAVPAYLALA